MYVPFYFTSYCDIPLLSLAYFLTTTHPLRDRLYTPRRQPRWQGTYGEREPPVSLVVLAPFRDAIWSNGSLHGFPNSTAMVLFEQ